MSLMVMKKLKAEFFTVKLPGVTSLKTLELSKTLKKLEFCTSKSDEIILTFMHFITNTTSQRGSSIAQCLRAIEITTPGVQENKSPHNFNHHPFLAL